MPCRSCQQARQALAKTLRAVASGDGKKALSSAQETAQHLAEKGRAEAERVRARLGRR